MLWHFSVGNGAATLIFQFHSCQQWISWVPRSHWSALDSLLSPRSLKVSRYSQCYVAYVCVPDRKCIRLHDTIYWPILLTTIADQALTDFREVRDLNHDLAVRRKRAEIGINAEGKQWITPNYYFGFFFLCSLGKVSQLLYFMTIVLIFMLASSLLYGLLLTLWNKKNDPKFVQLLLNFLIIVFFVNFIEIPFFVYSEICIVLLGFVIIESTNL